MTAKAIAKLSNDGQLLSCEGDWTLFGIKKLPRSFLTLLSQCKDNLQVNAAEIQEFDTVGAFRLRQLISEAEKSGKKITLTGLSKRHEQVFQLIDQNIKKIESKKIVEKKQHHSLELLGFWAAGKYYNFLQYLAFLGEIIVGLIKMRAHGAQNLLQSGLKIIQTSGCQALPIVGMMSFLVGIVLSYQLGVQLKIYGADIYVVDATGIAILREFAPLMTSVIVAGRTSTAFAALIGTMKVNDELDALSTMGISAIERLALPRVAGLLISLPLLVVWSCIFSILGSMVMAKSQLHIGYIAYLQRFEISVPMKHYLLGMVKTPIFAVIISTVGCFQGFQAGITADSVGLRTTAAAVQAIFLIIIADAFFSVLFSWRGL